MASTQVPTEQSVPETTLPTASTTITTPKTELETLALESLAKLDTLITLAGQVFQTLDAYSRQKPVNEDNEGEFEQLKRENFGIGGSEVREGETGKEDAVFSVENVVDVVERYRETEAELKEFVGKVDALKTKTETITTTITDDGISKLEPSSSTITTAISTTSVTITEQQLSLLPPSQQQEVTDENPVIVSLLQRRDEILKQSNEQSEQLSTLLEQMYRLQFIGQTLIGSFDQPINLEGEQVEGEKGGGNGGEKAEDTGMTIRESLEEKKDEMGSENDAMIL
ncbi:2036_t:CDS:2 [Ambispora gerdemannii]|uniref:2036_t:CDS:1 n=1 Tax=Ambispora gerdemannii TaxID=144530 RepID=A0A9N8V975_9GLOM|nr:2036_t:CDS:2 [Ambispora gerdemannii]